MPYKKIKNLLCLILKILKFRLNSDASNFQLCSFHNNEAKKQFEIKKFILKISKMV